MANRATLLGTVFQTVISGLSLDMDEGGGEHLETAVGEDTFDFGFPNSSGEFTISVWAKATIGSGSNNQQPYGFGNGGNVQNRFWFTHNVAANTMSMSVYRGLGFVQKNYSIGTLTIPALATWYMFTVTFDGNNNADSLKLYLQDELEATPTKGLDQDISALINVDMRANIGANGNNGGGFNADHRIYSLATWDSILTPSEISRIYNDHNPSVIDLRIDSGDYASSANLKNLYLLGRRNVPELGFDFGPQQINMTREVSLDNSNITSDFPEPTGAFAPEVVEGIRWPPAKLRMRSSTLRRHTKHHRRRTRQDCLPKGIRV